MQVRLHHPSLAVAFAVACVLVATLAAQVSKPPNSMAALTGQVVTDDGKPVAGTRISVVRLFLAGAGEEWPHAWPVESDAGGQFALPGLSPGAYSLEVSAAPGFVRSRPWHVDLTGGRASQVTIRLERTGTITGRVFGAGGQPLAGGMVRVMTADPLSGASRREAGTILSADGRFRVAVPAGDYYVLVDPLRATSASSLPPRSGYASTYYPGATFDKARREFRPGRVGESGTPAPGNRRGVKPRECRRI